MTQRLKVIISAYACRPGEGSEPGIGWDLVQEMAKYHQLWVLTRRNNQPFIDAALHPPSTDQPQFIYVDLPAWARWRSKEQRWVQLHYYLWQIAAYLVAHQLQRTVQFDLVHHVTYVKYWSPSFLALLPVPFLWGPVGGGESSPPAFWQDFVWRGKLYEIARNAARWLGERDPFVRLTAQRSVLVRATTEETAQRLHWLGAKEIEVYSQLGLSQQQLDELTSHQSTTCPPTRFISIGRLLHWKGFHLGLRAFAQSGLSEEVEYWIIGDGPERKHLQALAESLGIANRVRFWGKLPRLETLQRLAECSALVHPSLHESGGLVCLEAMATGCPVICLDLGGPAVQVVEGTGIKIAAHTPEQSVRDIATAMTTLAQKTKNTECWQQIRQTCQHHVQANYSWAVRAQNLAHLYSRLSGMQSHPIQDSLAVSEKL
jgi:glycosyltransferase involved in cell wall biosynthesis